MSAHWASEYIGAAWVAGTHDCRAFAEQVWRDRFGMEVNLTNITRELRQWRHVECPIEGDGVLMMRSGQPHVGVWIDADGGGVLHCMEGAGVIFSNRRALADMSWPVVRYYRRTA